MGRAARSVHSEPTMARAFPEATRTTRMAAFDLEAMLVKVATPSTRSRIAVPRPTPPPRRPLESVTLIPITSEAPDNDFEEDVSFDELSEDLSHVRRRSEILAPSGRDIDAPEDDPLATLGARMEAMLTAEAPLLAEPSRSGQRPTFSPKGPKAPKAKAPTTRRPLLARSQPKTAALTKRSAGRVVTFVVAFVVALVAAGALAGAMTGHLFV